MASAISCGCMLIMKSVCLMYCSRFTIGMPILMSSDVCSYPVTANMQTGTHLSGMSQSQKAYSLLCCSSNGRQIYNMSSMVAYLRDVHCESLVHGHKLTPVLKEFHQFRCRHILRRAGVEPFLRPESVIDSLHQALFSISVSLHHVEYFMSVNHYLSFLLFV